MEWKQKVPKIRYNNNDDILVKLAKINGITDLDSFLNPSIQSLHDPYSLDYIDVARDKIIKSIQLNNKISIFADCDNDGINSCAIMYNYLRKFTNNIEYFYVQREKGHGAELALDIIPSNTELLIIVDSSSSSVEACKILSERGIQIIILDHHDATTETRQYAVVVNPQLDRYKNKQISGAGVVWKMCQVLDDAFNTQYSNCLIDLAGIGIYGDMMSMFEMENRYIVDQSLKRVSNLGIKAIIKELKKREDNLTTTDLGFGIVPLINGAARMGRIEVALDILTCEDEKRCMSLAKELVKLNEERKVLQEHFLQKFLPKVNESDSVVVIIDDEIGKNFAGLVANDLAKKFHRPSMVLIPTEEDKIQGSFRSYSEFPMKKFLSNSPMIEFAAGHEFAGGVRLGIGQLESFIRYANEQINTERFNSTLEYDLELDVSEVNQQLIQKVQRFNRISGNRCEPAKFLVKGMFVSGKQLKGKQKKNTLEVDCGNLILMKFKTNEGYYNTFPMLTEVDAVGTLNLNKWFDWKERKDIITNQLFLEDYRTI